ncbi:suppressor of cytokine signaling 7 [Hypanus sabinus]|uniref:suppressor of cytokine signaling 7 n=1 Tax=Hypanus sabinus TaxID=79690 RepID=UPI0028C4D6B0|nr:suppressor of cytokine signaling 7 [Hypanus sabinus]XP_059812694.1 suppressor of cytokine signaling 7 [Hypanus sabinus]
MNPQASASFVLLHVVAPELQEGEAAVAVGSGLGLKPLSFDASRRPTRLLQDAACGLRHLELPAAKGSRPQLMVFGEPELELEPEPPAVARATGGGGVERPKRATSPRLCPRHRRCSGRARSRRDERVSDLARDFGDFTVGPGREECPAEPGGEGSAAPRPPAEETSDAVLVLGAMDEAGTELEAEAGPGADCPLRILCRSLGEEPPAACLLHREPQLGPPSPSSASPHQTEDPPAGRSRKTSLRSRLTKLFRARSCNGAPEPGAKRHSVQLQGPVDGTAPPEGPDTSKPRLTRTQSAFTPVSLAPPFTGETVSLVDLDISRRGLPSPHPPTPPPPPRRSLSLLDDIGGPQPPSYPVSPATTSLQSLPLPPPPPPHTSIQLNLILSDTSQRNLPQIGPMSLQPQHCPLTRRDSSSFAASLRELEKCGWYWGPMNWDDAEMKLKGKPDGSFLVRDSSDPRYILSLSFRSQGITHHTRMEHYRGTFSLWCHPKFEDRCQSVVEFIERAIMHSKNGKFLYFLRSRVPGLPPTPVQLLYPVSRFSNVKSLQHLCRFRIRQLVRIDHIPDLPLPKPLISYLRKFYYYDPEEETYLSLREARLSVAPEQDMDTQT